MTSSTPSPPFAVTHCEHDERQDSIAQYWCRTVQNCQNAEPKNDEEMRLESQYVNDRPQILRPDSLVSTCIKCGVS
jgi:hypothetical protein